MINIVPQCKEIQVFLDGNILHGDIEGAYVPDLEILKIDADAHIPPLDVELKVRGYEEILAAVGRAAGKPMQLEIQASIENNYGETGQASWKCHGKSMNIPTPFMPTTATTLKLNAHFYEHIINGEEKYYIDILKYIRRVDGVDQLEAIREGLGI